ncbi:MAG: class I SAM-dependent methyltransferase [Acidimicrobiales bacterium]
MWEQRFAEDRYFFGTEPNAFVAATVARLPRGRALCLAEGEGRNAVHLAAAGYEVASVDLTEAGVAKTRRLAAERGVEVDAQVGDLATFDLGAEDWDLVVSSFAHVPPAVRRRVHAQLPTALRPGGALVLEAYTPDQIGRGTGGPPVPELTMTLAALREELAGLDLVHAVELERPVLEGNGHTGLGAVVQVIAVRGADA